MMKKAICVGLAAITSIAFAETKELIPVGVVGASIGGKDISNTDDGDPDSCFAYALQGKYSLPVWNGFSLQIDGDYEGYDAEEDNVESQMAANLHLAYRNPDYFLLGAFGGYATGAVKDDDDDVSGFLYGLEGQYYLGRWTLYGQVGDAEVDNLDDSDNAFDGYFFTTALRYFPTKLDMMLQLGYEYGKSPDQFEDDDDWGKIQKYALVYEQRFSESLPLYGNIGLSYSDIEANTEDSGDVTSLMFGIKYYWGASSLFENDRLGATLSSSLLPSEGASWANVLD